VVSRIFSVDIYPSASASLLSGNRINFPLRQIVVHILPCAFVSQLIPAHYAKPTATPLADHRLFPCIGEPSGSSVRGALSMIRLILPSPTFLHAAANELLLK
jgi:hypothetical protein